MMDVQECPKRPVADLHPQELLMTLHHCPDECGEEIVGPLETLHRHVLLQYCKLLWRELLHKGKVLPFVL